MKIALACDHGGLQLKQHIAEYLQCKGEKVADFGTYTSDSCDYPDFARPCAQAVAAGQCDLGIVVCTTGIGVSIVANKVKGVRCALCLNEDMAEMCRRHNDANVLALGQKYVDSASAEKIVDRFLHTSFDGGRHRTRVDKIESV